jgi:hypothetical protein
MARVFFYRYFGDTKRQERPEVHSDDIPVPSKGDRITRKGKVWIVESVGFGITVLPNRTIPPRLECHIRLVSAENQAERKLLTRSAAAGR